MQRSAASIRPRVNSATGTALLPVVRATLMPSSRAVSRSRLSTPTPHLCSSFSLRRGAQHLAADADLAGDGVVGVGDDLLHVIVAARGAVGEHEARRQQRAQPVGASPA